MTEFFRRLYWRCIWSWAGVRDTWASEYSFRSWVWVMVISDAMAIWLLRGAELALILSLGMLILAAELMNTGIERVVDDVSRETREAARLAKDAASAAVAVTAIAGGIAWLAVLLT